MNFDPYKIDLPVREIIDELKEKLSTGNTAILNAPPGAGKSTLLPLALLNEPWLKDKKILMLEPRRLAAKSIAERMSTLLGEEVGQTVGYRIRFENKISKATRIEVLTEGILTRMIQSDKTLPEAGLVIFDEFHERSIHADLAMAFTREAQQKYRPDLKMLVMSATLNTPELMRLLDAPCIKSEGRQFPVEIIYTGEADELVLAEQTVQTVLKAVKEQQGDVLVFLPGEADIRKCEELLRHRLKDFQIHALYGMLPYSRQYAAIMPDRNGRRKIVLSTSIAETSLTIEGIKIVIDTGFGRTSRFDPASGLSRLETIKISKDSADQRAGRAGRLSPGVCYRMWTKQSHANLKDHRTPEIMESELSSLVLDLASWGISNPDSLTWLNPPPRPAILKASEILQGLEAIENGNITELGSKMQQLPCHPRIAHMLLKAEELNKVSLATDIAALLEERDPLSREAGIDINERIKALRRSRRDGNNSKQFNKIEKIASSYRNLFKISADNSSFDSFETGFLLANCYPERIAFARPGNNAQFQLANGAYASASHKDSLADESWLVIANLDARSGMGKIFLASPLNPKDLMPLLKEKDVVKWDIEDGNLKASRDLRIGSIVLKSKPLPTPDPSLKPKAIAEVLSLQGDELLNFDEEFNKWQKRMLSLRSWRTDENWPDVSIPSLLLIVEDWLGPYFEGIGSREDLGKINIVKALEDWLGKEKTSLFNKLAPAEFYLTDGTGLELEYDIDNLPLLQVRLQDMLDLGKHPAINGGETALVLQLFSPKFELLGISTNLEEYWKTEYPKIKDKLKKEYDYVNWDLR